MGDTDHDPTAQTPPAQPEATPTPEVDPEQTVVVPGSATSAAPTGADSEGDGGEETTKVVSNRPRVGDLDRTQLAPPAPAPQAAQWASSPMTPPPPATETPAPQGVTQNWPQSPMTPAPGSGSAPAAQSWPQSPITPTPAPGNPPVASNWPGAPAPQPWPGTPVGAPLGGPPAPPMGFGPLPSTAHPAGRDRRTRLIAGGAVGALLIVIVLITGLWWPGYFNTDTLDVKAAEAGVQQVLTDSATGYGLPKVSDVACNNGQNPKITANGTFTCTVTIAGSQRHVTVRFVGTDGTYAVGRPE